MSTPFFLAANWKMYKNPEEAQSFLDQFRTLAPVEKNKKIVFFVPALQLLVAQKALSGYGAGWGPQNTHYEDEGAFTGETSPKVIADMGAEFALVGHSERRSHFKETNQDFAKKISSLQKHGVTPIYCIGETLEERQSGKTLAVLGRQLTGGLSELDKSKPFHIAYEPVWAIGTGEVATSEQVAEAHLFIRNFLKEFLEGSVAPAILYGGSVKPNNAKELSELEDVGGFLIGSASLKVDSFIEIIGNSQA